MTTGTNRNAYHRRIQQVVSYICSHLDDDLSVDKLSEVAGFSKFHFHRQFSEYTGFGVAELVRLTRLKRAAYQLAFQPDRRIIEIALDAGFAAPESFTRAFKDAHGQTPSEFRQAPQWLPWTGDRDSPIPSRSNSMNPDIVQFQATRVATLEHRGAVETLMGSVARFIEWRRSCHDSPVTTCRTLGIAYSDPKTTPPDEFRFDICGELRGELRANDAGVVQKTIPTLRCAVARHIGSTDAIGKTVHELYAKWLPDSGEQPGDFPVFFHYVERMPQVAEHEQVTDVYLPLR